MSFNTAAIKNRPFVDFSTLSLPDKKNYALVYKHQQTPRVLKAPVFPVTEQELQRIWLRVVAAQSRLKMLKNKDDHFQYVEYSRLLGFPDLLDVHIVSLSEKSSTIYLYSRSVYGYYDFGVNQRRVNNLLARVSRRILETN